MLDSQEIIISIDGRLAEARKEIASLEAALKAMSTRPANGDTATSTATRSNGTTRARSGTARGAGAKTRSRTTRRAKPAKRTDAVPAGKLITLLGAGDGMTTADLVGQTGGDRQQLLTLLRELEAAGEVRRSGQRRNTRWHVITDEDRIAARVAELERARSRKPKAA